MTDIICPLCNRPNPPELDECKFCGAPLKTGGFISPSQGNDELEQLLSSLEEAPQPEGQTETPGSVSVPEEPAGITEEAPPSQEPAKEPEASPMQEGSVEAAGESSQPEAAIPDWLKDLQSSTPEPNQEQDTGDESGLEGLSGQIDSLLSEPPAIPREQTGQSDLDWLTSLRPEKGESESTPGSEVNQAFTTQSTDAPSPAAGAGENEPGEEDQPFWAEGDEEPAWLSSLSPLTPLDLEQRLPTAGDERVEPEQAEPEETPGAEAQQPESETLPPMADLLKGLESSPEEPSAEAAPAELPGWLEALKPVEPAPSKTPAEDLSGADIVTAGPLAGLRGVISPHPSTIRARKPPTYSIKLRVTDDQRARVEMMEELLANEDKPSPLPAQSSITRLNLIRLLVAILILLPIVWMVVTKRQQVTSPQPGNLPGLVDFSQRIASLPAEAPVLMAMEYEAGFSGELNTALNNILTSLMQKPAFITLVSTAPSGPPLSENAIKAASAKTAGSSASYTYYANLGYLPGGTLGLRGLITSLHSSLPYTLQDKPAWSDPPLNKVTAITDFKAVIIVTNDPENARMWIEQVGPTLQEAGIPLLFICSAQAEPLIRPYYEASPQQVQGIVAGLAGGLAFNPSAGNAMLNGAWDGYSISVLISFLIILVGSIAGGVYLVIKSEKKPGDQE